MICDCPFTVEDIKIAEDIGGKDISYLKGKTMRSRPTPVRHDNVDIPMELKSKHLNIMLCIHTIYINKIPFLMSIRLPLYFWTYAIAEDKTDDEYLCTLDKVLRVYNGPGYMITSIECDGEYKSLMDTNSQIHLSRSSTQPTYASTQAKKQMTKKILSPQ